MNSRSRVVVIAGSIEGIDALARLINQLPDTLPIPIVAHLHGPRNRALDRLMGGKWRFPSGPEILRARDGDRLEPGRVYVIPADEDLVFVGVDLLGLVPGGAKSNADRLFASAAHWYQAEVIGVVLSGLGTDGTEGLRAITEVEGTRVIQSPNEAAFFSMPLSALRLDSVQYSVVLDRLGHLIMSLVAETGTEQTMSPEMIEEVARQALTSSEDRTESLDHSIIDILNVMRQELVMDIVFVPRQMADDEIVDHSDAGWVETSFHGVSYTEAQSLCQRAFDGRLSMVMPDAAESHPMRDVPATSITPGIYMAMPVWLQSGALFGTLCCLSPDVLPELQKRYRQRLRMSARQIARLVDEPGGQ